MTFYTFLLRENKTLNSNQYCTRYNVELGDDLLLILPMILLGEKDEHKNNSKRLVR